MKDGGCSGLWGAISALVSVRANSLESFLPPTDGICSIQLLIGRYLVLVGVLWGIGGIHSSSMYETRPEGELLLSGVAARRQARYSEISEKVKPSEWFNLGMWGT